MPSSPNRKNVSRVAYPAACLADVPELLCQSEQSKIVLAYLFLCCHLITPSRR